MSFFNSLKNQLKTHREGLNSCYIFVVLAYFLVVFLPNITVSIPVLSVINTGFAQIIYRVVFAILFGAYTLLLVFINKIQIERKVLYVFCAIFFILFISVFFNLYSLQTVSYNNYYEKVYTTAMVGIIDTFSYIGNIFISIIFTLSLFTVLPSVAKNRNQYFLVFEIFVYIMAALCLLSFVIDFKLYLSFFRFKIASYDENGISSLFASKNAFGEFLFQGLMVSTFLSVQESGKKRTLFAIFAVLFFFVTIATLCKNAIFASALFLLVYSLYYITNRTKFYKKALFSLIAIFVFLLFVLIFLFLVIQPDKNNKLFKSIYTLLGSNPVAGGDTSLGGRFKIIGVFFAHASFTKLFVGYAQALPNHVFMWTFAETGGNYGNSNLHNSYLHVLGTGGFVYLIFYLCLIAYIFYILSKFPKKENQTKYVLLGILISYLFYSLFETSMLVFSASSATFIISLLLVPFSINVCNRYIRRREELFAYVEI